MNLNFRTLTAREIECRIQQQTDKGLILLLYKDARCDMAILDETVGAMNWQRKHSRDNANCTIYIWDDSKHEWVGKEDTGTESNTEAEKGLASDSFKRSGTNWGIGRELYTSPFIWVKAGSYGLDSRGKCRDKFAVKDIGYNHYREICYLVIVNEKSGDVVYTFGKHPSGLTQYSPAPKPESNAMSHDEIIATLHNAISGVTDAESANRVVNLVKSMHLADDDKKTANKLLTDKTNALNLVYTKNGYVRKG